MRPRHLVIALLSPCVAGAQGATVVAMGTPLQISRSMESESGAITQFVLHGRYAGFIRDHVVLTQSRAGDTLRIPYAQVAQVKVPGGKQHKLGRDLFIGILGGAVLGGALDLVMNKDKTTAPRRAFIDFRRPGVRELTLVGAVGGVVAASVGRTQWVLVDKGALRSP